MWTGDAEGASWKREVVVVGITGLEGENAHSVESGSLIQNDSHGSVLSGRSFGYHESSGGQLGSAFMRFIQILGFVLHLKSGSVMFGSYANDDLFSIYLDFCKKHSNLTFLA